ncbi:hypothetical protein ACFL20_08890 [Spirochaetota bacterium]
MKNVTKQLAVNFFFSIFLLSSSFLFTGCEFITDPLLSIPEYGAIAVAFTDTDPGIDEIGGIVSITRAIDETDITGYVIYWGISETAKLNSQDPIIVLTVNGSNQEYSIAENTTIPDGASHLLVYTKNDDGEMNIPMAVQIEDYKNCSIEYPYSVNINFTYTGAPVEGGDVVRFAIFDANNHGADMCDSGNSWAFPTNTKCLQEFTIENNVTTVLQLRSPVPEFYMYTYLDKASITSSMGPGVIEEGYPYFVYNDLNVNDGFNATLIDTGNATQQNLTMNLDDTNIWSWYVCSQ